MVKRRTVLKVRVERNAALNSSLHNLIFFNNIKYGNSSFESKHEGPNVV
jgi:hypothetical protein